jgi:hypothetical protein
MTTASANTTETPDQPRGSRRRLTLWAAGAALLVAVALAASGCGGGGTNSASASNTTASSAGGSGSAGGSVSSGSSNADVAYAQCMRSHGVGNFPDNAVSSTGSGTKVGLPAGVTSNPDYSSASQACQSKLPEGSSGGSSSANTQALLKLASCMRAHGVTNYPEPNAQGRMIITGGSGGVDPNSPTYQAAWKVCRSDLPNNGAGLGG